VRSLTPSELMRHVCRSLPNRGSACHVAVAGRIDEYLIVTNAPPVSNVYRRPTFVRCACRKTSERCS